MFRITRGPSSGSSTHSLAKITVMVFFMSVDMDVVGVMAAYLPVVRVCTAQSREALSRLCSAQQICYHNTDYVHINGQDRTITVILAKHCIEHVLCALCTHTAHTACFSASQDTRQHI